jgi:hypothetical protein
MPVPRAVMARAVVEAPRETLRFVVEARVSTLKILVVAFPEMTRSLAKVYVPAPAKVPGAVVMTPVEELYEITPAPESEEEEILFWKVL